MDKGSEMASFLQDAFINLSVERLLLVGWVGKKYIPVTADRAGKL